METSLFALDQMASTWFGFGFGLANPNPNPNHGLDRVDALAVDVDGEAHEVGVLADVLLDREALLEVWLRSG